MPRIIMRNDPTMTLSRRAILSWPSTRALPSGGHWLHVHRQAMACRFEVTIPSEDGARLATVRRVLETVDDWESRLTVFGEDGELIGVNRNAAAGPVPVERDLLELLALCAELHDATGGAFDVTSTPLSRCWGFFRREGRVPTEEERAAALACVGMHNVSLDDTEATVTFRRPGVELNLGSIGKGYAIDRLKDALVHHRVRNALLSAGSSSLFGHGGGVDGQGWLVGLRDPRNHARRIGTVRLRDAGLGVSGVGEQSFVDANGRHGHIIDPRTGLPASGMALSAVVAPEAALADALATACFVGGPEVAERVAPRYAASVLLMTIDEDGTLRPVIIGDSRCHWELGHGD